MEIMSGTGVKSQAASTSVTISTKPSLNSASTKMESNKITTSKSGDDKQLYFFPVEKVTEQDLKNLKKKKVEVNGENIALISHDNKVYAIQEKCPHYGGPLHRGDIEDMPVIGPCIRCPWHSWKFSLQTGKCVSPQREDKCLKIFPVQVVKETQQIKIGFEKIAESIFSTPP